MSRRDTDSGDSGMAESVTVSVVKLRGTLVVRLVYCEDNCKVEMLLQNDELQSLFKRFQ